MEKKKLLRAVIGLLILLLVSMPAYAFSPSIEGGISWLTAHQNADGSWGSNADFAILDTSTALDTFKSLNIGSPAYANGVTWLSSQSPLSTDFIARKVISLSIAGVDVSSDLSLLVTMRSLDGGWGGDADSTGAINDTVLALQALRAANYLDQNIISSALGFLLSTQNPDGGWGFYPAACATCQADPSNCYMTAMVASTLQQFTLTTSTVKAINKATDYLVAHQNTDGGFGSSQSTIFETALAYIALVGVTTDVTILGKTASYLTSQQLANGSWLDDPYATALAVKALYLAENKPQPPPPPDKGTATGKVIDSSTNALLKDVSVALEADPAIKTTTDQAGTFSLANCPPGSQKLIFALPGYAGASASLTITAGTIVDLGSIPLSPNPTTGMVKGLVTEAASGNPLSGVTIDMTGSATATTTTAADGSFSFIDVAPGQVTLTASKAGYYAVTGSGSVLAGGTLFFNPQLPTTPPSATTGSLIGKVFDAATNQPIQGASIALGGGPSATTGSNGAFTITDITPNTYQVTIAASGYNAQVYQVMIMAGVTINMQTIYLTPAPQTTTITGKITDASTGTAIAGADVLITDLGIAAKSSADGSYTLSGITLLEFTIRASAIGYNTKFVNAKTSTYGVYSVDIGLDQSQVSSIKITSITTDKPEYPANDIVNIVATIENTGDISQDILVNTQIADVKGNLLAIISDHDEPSLKLSPHSSATVTMTWNTGQNPPGVYDIRLQVIGAANGSLLAEGPASLSIIPTMLVDGVAAIASPKFMNVKATETITLSASLTNRSNIDTVFLAEYAIKDPGGNTINSGTVEFSLAAQENFKVVTLGQFTYTFTQSGQYPININIFSGSNLIALGSDALHVAPAIRVEPKKALSPTTVTPDGSKKIRIDIQIEGVEDKP